MATPFVALPELQFEEAVEAARSDLESRLDVLSLEIETLPPESEAILGQPVECPALPALELDLHYVYLQYKQFVYPYQVFRPLEVGAELSVEACEDVLIDEDVIYIPTPDARGAITELVIADLTARSIDTSQGEFELVRSMTWTDDRLGCPIRPGQEAPSSVITEGFLMLYNANGITYEYHTDSTGEQIIYCEPPPGYTSVPEFIAMLQLDPLTDARIVEDEVALVEGLAGEGVMVALTDSNFRIGVFGFDSNSLARASAAQITDLAVWRAFVSDRVLIVLYDTSPPAYSLLLKYAEEVNLPAQDFSDPTPEPDPADGA